MKKIIITLSIIAATVVYANAQTPAPKPVATGKVEVSKPGAKPEVVAAEVLDVTTEPSKTNKDKKGCSAEEKKNCGTESKSKKGSCCSSKKAENKD
jgi:hypothetical protein